MAGPADVEVTVSLVAPVEMAGKAVTDKAGLAARTAAMVGTAEREATVARVETVATQAKSSLPSKLTPPVGTTRRTHPRVAERQGAAEMEVLEAPLAKAVLGAVLAASLGERGKPAAMAHPDRTEIPVTPRRRSGSKEQ